LLTAVRANRLRPDPLGATVSAVLAACADLPDDHRDRDLTADLEVARGLIPSLTAFVDLQLPDSSWENDTLGL
jgi:hypothetical protein